MTEENAMAPLPWGREVIEGILPHRDPFVWVTVSYTHLTLPTKRIV